MNLNNDVLRFLIVKTDDLPDLGAKDRRKAQEMAAQKLQGPQRPAPRPQQGRDNNSGRPQRPTQYAPRPTAPRPAATAATTKASGEMVSSPAKKESGKDIDKQLDALLG